MPRTMSEKHEASLRDLCGIGETLTVADQLLAELDAERAAHSQTIQAAEKLAEALKYSRPYVHTGIIQDAPRNEVVFMLDAALAQYAATKEGGNEPFCFASG